MSSTSSTTTGEVSCNACSPRVPRLIDSWITNLIALRVASVADVLSCRLSGEKKAIGMVAPTTSPLL